MSVNKQKLIGKYVKASSEKTIVVQVERRYIHPKYKKVVKVSKKYLVDFNGEAEINLGDKVVIVSCRPISKLKRFRFLSLLNDEVKA